VSLPIFQPLPLSRARAPFSHPDWLFEIKWDGFRALLYSDNDGVRLISRNGNTFKSFPALCEGLARDLKGRRCVLDGEIVCLDPNGKPQFRDLLFRRAEPSFTRSTFSGMNTPKRTMSRRTSDSEMAKTFAICR
jgi:ATP-dependent DNA ligase